MELRPDEIETQRMWAPMAPMAPMDPCTDRYTDLGPEYPLTRGPDRFGTRRNWDPMKLRPDEIETQRMWAPMAPMAPKDPYIDRYTDLGPENPLIRRPDKFGAR